MKATFHSKYNKLNKAGLPITMFRYIVSGTAAELEHYQLSQEALGFYRESDSGEPYFFTGKYTGDVVQLGITDKGKVYVDTTTLDKFSSIINAYPGALGTAMANIAAAQIMSNMMSSGAKPVAQKEDALPGAELPADLDPADLEA